MSYVKSTPDIVKEINESLQTLVKKAEDTIPTPIKLIFIDTPKSINTSPSWMFKPIYSYQNLNISQINDILKKYESDLAQEIESSNIHGKHLINLESIKNNKLIIEKITFIMDSIGISDYSTYAYKTARSSTRTETKHIAGYKTDLNRVIQIKDNYDSVLKNITEHQKSVNEYATKLIDDIQKDERAKATAKKDEERNKVLSYLSVKYELGYIGEAIEILNVILSKSNLLTLAHAMYCTREWHRDFHLVRTALFTPITEIETNIIKEVQCILEGGQYDYEDDEADCRVFRDCMFNYDVIFKIVDEKLYEDYKKLMVYAYE
jgi:hypothetical protein